RLNCSESDGGREGVHVSMASKPSIALTALARMVRAGRFLALSILRRVVQCVALFVAGSVFTSSELLAQRDQAWRVCAHGGLTPKEVFDACTVVDRRGMDRLPVDNYVKVNTFFFIMDLRPRYLLDAKSFSEAIVAYNELIDFIRVHPTPIGKGLQRPFQYIYSAGSHTSIRVNSTGRFKTQT